MKSTKEMARELGILRKRTLTKSSAVDGNRKRAKKSNQIFSFLIIIDFESTCWQGERHRTQEIIEFPAVLLNTETGQIESEFHRYVQPQENPILSDFCKQLTGITQDQVDEATPLFICLRQFSTWLTEMSATKALTFGATDGASKPTAFVTWSDWDLGVCLQYECRRKQLRKPAELGSWIDLRATYRRYYQRKPQGLNGALQELGVSFEGREHSGLDDARNTAYLAWKMICDGCIMEITKTQTNAVIGRNVPQVFQKPPSNPVMKNTSKNAKTPERQKITDIQRGCENAKSEIATPRKSPKNTQMEVQPDHKENVTPRRSPRNARKEVQPTHGMNCTSKQSPKNTRQDIQPAQKENGTPKQLLRSNQVEVQPPLKVSGTPRKSQRNIQMEVQPSSKVNSTPKRCSPKNVRMEVQPTRKVYGTPRQLLRNNQVEVEPPQKVSGAPMKSPENTKMDVNPSRKVNENLSDWGVDEIGDDDILQYLAIASPSFRNSSTVTVLCVSELSYGSMSSGLAVRMQGQTIKTPTSLKKRIVLRDVTNSPSCIPTANYRSGKMLSHSPLSKSSSNSMIFKNCASPTSNCRKALLQESAFTKIKSPATKSTLTTKSTLSSLGIVVGSSDSCSSPKNHCKLVRQLPHVQTLPTSSGSSVQKPVLKSMPSKAVGVDRIPFEEGAHIVKKPHAKTPVKTLIRPPAVKMSSNSVSVNRGKIDCEQMSNPAIVKDVHGGSLNGRTSESAKGHISSMQKPQAASKFGNSSDFSMQKAQATPGCNISSGSSMQKPQTTPRGNTSNSFDLQRLQAHTPRVVTPVRPYAQESQVSTTSEQRSMQSTVNRAANVTTPSTNVTSFFRTPIFGSGGSAAPSSSMRKTPPMCDCGCRAKRKFVQSPGPNLGKAFFCCGSQRSRTGSGCKFFRWEASDQLSPLSRSNHQTPGGRKTRMFNSPMIQPQFNTPSVLTRPR